MRSKAEIVSNWLPRYTGASVETIGEYILLTNFQHYVDVFAQAGGVEVRGRDHPWVSRGGLKLEGALRDSGVDVTGLTCLDVGQSTGGFTDCLLQHGAAQVIGCVGSVFVWLLNRRDVGNRVDRDHAGIELVIR